MKKFIVIIFLLGVVACSQEQEQEQEQEQKKELIYRFICVDKEPVIHKKAMKVNAYGDVVTNYADVDYHLTIKIDEGEIHFINKEPEITFSNFDDLTFNENFNNTSDEVSAMSSLNWKFTFDKFSGKAKVLREPENSKGAVNTYSCVKAPSLID